MDDIFKKILDNVQKNMEVQIAQAKAETKQKPFMVVGSPNIKVVMCVN